MKIVIDTGQDGTIINARVRQKAATEAEWLSKDPEILDGEAAFVRRADGAPVNFKLGDGNKKFSELPYFVTGDAGEFINVMGSELPVSGPNFPDKGYAVVGPGTYTQSGGPDVVVPSGHMGILNWDGSEWYMGSSVALPKGAQPVDWVADFYEKGYVVFKDNATWIADENATSLDEPGVSDVWVKVSGGTASPLDILDSHSTSAPLSANMGRELDEKITDVRQGGVDNDSLGLDKLTQEARDFIGSGGNISNNPDGEDLTAVDEGGVQVLKFRDRGTAEGLGYKILRLEGNNVLASSDFDPNTIHEIRYDFDLDGGKLELPENVTLKFNGGSISNGEIVGDNTKIDAGLNRIFDEVEFSGTFQIEAVYPEWFGAVSYERSYDDFNDASQDLLDGVDSSDAINLALSMAYNTSGAVVKLVGLAYKISRVYMPDTFCELYISPNTVIHAVAQGDSQKVCLQDKELLTFQEYSVTDPEVNVINQTTGQPFNYVVALRENEFISSSSMAHVISMPSWGGRITGRGTLVLRNSKFAVGVYVRSNTYKSTDMAFAPHVDIRIYDGGWSNVTGSKSDLYGTGLPSSELGEIGDWYWQVDKPDGQSGRFIKESGGWSQKSYYFERGFNTSIRLEAGLGDNRIINFNGYIYNLSGFRGVEFIVHGVRGGSGGWINSSFWEGTISNKTGGGIYFFGEPDMDDHDFSRVNMQLGAITSDNFRFIYGQPRRSKFGKIWDLYYFRNSIRSIGGQIELLRGSMSNEVDSNGYLDFVIDDGWDNNLTRGLMPTESDFQKGVTGYNYINLLKYRSPIQAVDRNQISSGRLPNFKFYTSEKTAEQYIEDSYSTFEDVGDRIDWPSRLFDEDIKTGEFIIDLENGIYGAGGHLISSPIFRANYGARQHFLSIQYCQVPGTSSINDSSTEVYASVGYSNLGDDYVNLVKERYSYRFRFRGTQTKTLLIPIDYGRLAGFDYSSQRIFLSIYTLKAPENFKLYIQNIKVLSSALCTGGPITESDLNRRRFSDTRYGNTESRPNSAPKGHVYYDTTVDAPFINVGDSETQVWKKILTEE